MVQPLEPVSSIGPQQSPVLASSPFIHDEDLSCRACYSQSIRTDWAQGDRICTNCGVVHTEQIMDPGPEWREYENDDNPNPGAKARSGMVVNDETKYIGGLQPTTISRHIYGRSAASGENVSALTTGMNLRQRLAKANQRMDKLMERKYRTAYQNAHLSLQILRRRQKQQAATESAGADNTDTDTVNTNTVAGTDIEPDYGSNVVWMEERPELEQQIIENEQKLAATQKALYADKWSIDRAKAVHENNTDIIDELDETLIKAAKDLYTAYEMLLNASNSLKLPITITDEAANWLSRYASKRDGMKVKGVSTLPTNNKINKQSTKRKVMNWKTKNGHRTLLSPTDHHNNKKKSDNNVDNNISDELNTIREINKRRQMGALCAALLFWIARNRHRQRSLSAVCQSINIGLNNNNCIEKIQRTQCSKAMNELKEVFPELATRPTVSPFGDVPQDITIKTDPDNSSSSIVRSANTLHTTTTTTTTSITAVNVSNFVEHALGKLTLPPVAETSVRCLMVHWMQQRRNDDNVNLSKLCAAMTYFVCRLGSIMQQMATQAQESFKRNNTLKRKYSSDDNMANNEENKKKKCDDTKAEVNEIAMEVYSTYEFTEPSVTDFDLNDPQNNKSMMTEQRAYEMHRMWDAWSEQLSWSRSSTIIGKATGVSSNVLVEFFKNKLYPERQSLLRVLRDVSNQIQGVNTTTDYRLLNDERVILSETPLASTLFPHVSIAVMLMKSE